MNYITYFELPLNGFWDWSLAIPLALLVFGIPFFLYREQLRKFNRATFPINFPLYKPLENFVYSKKFIYLWIGGVIFITVISYSFVYSEYSKARSSLLTGEVNVVEGTIYDYKAGTNQRGSAYDTFCVQNTCFEVSDWEVTSGFHQMIINGSPLRDGLPVRISFVGDVIVKLEIASQN